GELVPVFLNRQGGRPLLVADLVLALPRPDRVRLAVLRARKAAEPEYQRCHKDRLHDRLQEMEKMAGGEAARREPPPAADGDSRDAANNGKDGVAKRRFRGSPIAWAKEISDSSGHDQNAAPEVIRQTLKACPLFEFPSWRSTSGRWKPQWMCC